MPFIKRADVLAAQVPVVKSQDEMRKVIEAAKARAEDKVQKCQSLLDALDKNPEIFATLDLFNEVVS